MLVERYGFEAEACQSIASDLSRVWDEVSKEA